MAKPLIYRAFDDEPVVRLRARLRDPTPVLEAIGAMGVSISERSFKDQRLGKFRWAERYPKQGDPFVNVAAITRDFTEGKNPPARRFERRPALIDTSHLRRSIAKRVLGTNAVEWGTNVPYGALHQFGGESVQPVTETTKQNLARWLRKKKRDPQTGKLVKVHSAYREKLGFLFQQKTLATKVGSRPFVGIPVELEQDIVRRVEEEVTK